MSRFFLKYVRLAAFVGALLSVGAVWAGDWYKITLQSGVEYEGMVELQNDDVVVFRTVKNARFQFPKSEVVMLSPIADVVVQDDSRAYIKRFGVLLSLDGGMAWRDSFSDWTVGGVLQFGATNLFDRHVFLGGGVGVDAYGVGGSSIFLPLILSLAVPLMTTADAPFVGIDGGYGFALRGAQRGGFAGGVKFGWLHRFESQTSIQLSLKMGLQQGVFQTESSFENSDYVYTAHRMMPRMGLCFAVIL